jgi:hypothetical protein
MSNPMDQVLRILRDNEMERILPPEASVLCLDAAPHGHKACSRTDLQVHYRSADTVVGDAVDYISRLYESGTARKTSDAVVGTHADNARLNTYLLPQLFYVLKPGGHGLILSKAAIKSPMPTILHALAPMYDTQSGLTLTVFTVR